MARAHRRRRESTRLRRTDKRCGGEFMRKHTSMPMAVLAILMLILTACSGGGGREPGRCERAGPERGRIAAASEAQPAESEAPDRPGGLRRPGQRRRVADRRRHRRRPARGQVVQRGRLVRHDRRRHRGGRPCRGHRDRGPGRLRRTTADVHRPGLPDHRDLRLRPGQRHRRRGEGQPGRPVHRPRPAGLRRRRTATRIRRSPARATRPSCCRTTRA